MTFSSNPASTETSGVSFRAAAAAIHPELIAFRRDLHQHPELGNHLPRTQAAILAALEGLPVEVYRGSGLTSVVAVLRGGARGHGQRRTVLLRGDMDALPIQEQTGLEFASTNENMHACGHDMHTAGLLGAAMLLSDRMHSLSGDVVFMFQPGEEGPGGAKPMIEEGLLEITGRRPDAAYALHVLSSEEAGMWSTRPGTLLAGVMDLTITVVGRGGHGSIPHASVDPVPVAAEIVLALQSYVTRRANVFDPIVITVGQIAAGTAANVIPDTATLCASVRVLSRASIDRLQDDLPRLAAGIAYAHGCEARTELALDLPPTVNDDAETAFVLGELTALHGEERVRNLPDPRLGSEDFAFVLQEIPGAFMFLGAHPTPIPATPPTNHSSKAMYDENILIDQAATLAHLAYRKIVGAE